MKLNTLFPIFITALLAGGAGHAAAATVTWSGAGDGLTWGSAANWAGGALPGANSDVVISGGAGTQVQLGSGSATIRSLASSKPLIIKGAGLYLNAGNSTISGAVYLTNAGTISVRNPGTRLTISGLGTLDGNVIAQDGAQISVPNLRHMTNFSYTSGFKVYGAGSLIEFGALTNISATPNSRIYLEAYEGGRIDAPAVLKTANGVKVYARDADSRIDLSGLTGRFASKAEHAATLSARDDGVILAEGITQLDNVEVIIANGGALATAQWTVATNSTITVENAAPDFSSLAQIPDTELYCHDGGTLSLPLVAKAVTTAYTLSWKAQDASSLIELPALIHLQVAPNSRHYLEAYDGGQVDVHALATTTNSVQVFARGAGSLVDLSALAGRWSSKSGHAIKAVAEEEGSVLIPKVTELDNAEITIRAATLPTAQIKLMTNCALTVAGMAPNLNALKDIPDTEFLADDGGSITLPAVTGTSVKNYTLGWIAMGANSLVSFPALARIDIAPNSRLYAETELGGRVDLRNVTQVVNALRVQSTDPGSSVDLSSLSGRWAARGGHQSSVDARRQGTILIPKVTEMENLTLYSYENGQINTSQLTTLTNCEVFLSASAPDFRSLRFIPNTDITVEDAGVARLTNVTQVAIDQYTRLWESRGAGSLIDLSSLRQIDVAPNSRHFIETYEGGRIDLRNLNSLSTGAVRFLSDGSGSTIDLRGLSSFVNIGNHTSLLQTRNGGSFLFNDEAFVLSRVQIDLPSGNAVLPSSLAASSQATLYGQPWQSYWIERRYTSPMSTDWIFTARVPLTNSFQPFTLATSTNVLYRLWKFTAQQPIVDPIRASLQNKFGVVLYGQPQSAYQLLSTRDFSGPWTAETTVTMTNSFRIFAPSTMVNPFKFYRAKKQ